MIRVRALALAASAALAILAGPAAARPARPSDMLGWSPAQQAIGFRTVERRFNVHAVRRGAHVLRLPSARTPLAVAFAYGGVTYTTDSYMKADRLSGVLAIRHGRIMLEHYGLGRGPGDRWTSFSVTKSVTSTLVGAALRDGSISSLDDKVVRYLPEMAGSAYDDVSVRDLLTMSSGVRWTENYGDPNSDVVRIGSFAAPAGMDPIVAYMRTLPRVAPPGAHFQYKSGEADLTAALVARATGESAAAYLSEKIWRPFGMERDAVWIVDSAGIERGGCCLSMSLRDYGRFGLFMLGGGRAGGRAVLPADWIALATTTRIATGAPGGGGYGFLWWTGGDGSYHANGIFGQAIDLYPGDDLVIVTNGAWPSPATRDLAARRLAFVDAVRAAARAAP